MEKKKPLIVVSICAVVLLVLGSLSNVVGYQENNLRKQEIIDHENSSLQVVITRPENGVYFKEEKILPFCVPLVISGNITIWWEVINGSGFNRLDIYINDVLQYTFEGPGPEYGWCLLPWKPFSKLTFKVIAYSFDESASDEIVI